MQDLVKFVKLKHILSRLCDGVTNLYEILQNREHELRRKQGDLFALSYTYYHIKITK